MVQIMNPQDRNYRRDTETQRGEAATKTMFTTETWRHRGIQSQNGRAQRWQGARRRDPQRFSGLASRESPRLAKILARSSIETQRRRERQRQNGRAQRWQGARRRDPQRLSGLGSQESPRLAKILALSSTETQRIPGKPYAGIRAGLSQKRRSPRPLPPLRSPALPLFLSFSVSLW